MIRLEKELKKIESDLSKLKLPAFLSQEKRQLLSKQKRLKEAKATVERLKYGGKLSYD